FAADDSGPASARRRTGPVAAWLRPGQRGRSQVRFPLSALGPAGRSWPVGGGVGASGAGKAAPARLSADTGGTGRARRHSGERCDAVGHTSAASAPGGVMGLIIIALMVLAVAAGVYRAWRIRRAGGSADIPAALVGWAARLLSVDRAEWGQA